MSNAPHLSFSRRAFLRVSATSAGALLAAQHARAAGPRTIDLTGAFPLGVASGDPTSSSVMVWTQTNRPGPATLAVWKDTGAELGLVLQADLALKDGGFCRAVLEDLSPSTRYRYGFTVGEAASEVGTFTTAPPDDALVPLAFAATCCTKNGRSMDLLGEVGAERDLSFLLQLGDTSYNDGAYDLASYRAKWAENLSQPGYRIARAHTSVVATWDDHEVTNNFDPETHDPVELAAAQAAFFEHMPMQPAVRNRIWRRRRFGRTLDLFVLDVRGERRASRDELISSTQMEWLKRELAASDAVFKLVVTSVPISTFPPLFRLWKRGEWDGYTSQREELLAHIEDNRIPGVAFLAGDFHLSCLGSVSNGGRGSTLTEVLVGPGSQVTRHISWMLWEPQFTWRSATENYARISLSPDTREMRVQHMAEGGFVLGDNVVRV